MSEASMNDASRHDPPPDDTTLHAYVDGELTPAEAARVAVWLQAHPVEAQRVLAWQAQRQQMQALRLELLDGPLPADLVARLSRSWERGLDTGDPSAAGTSLPVAAQVPEPQPAPIPMLAQPEAAAVSTPFLSSGAAASVGGPPRLAANGPWRRVGGVLTGLAAGLVLGWLLRGQTGNPADATLAQAQAPAFVRDAGVAHALYTPERRHPVEVGAEQQDHLVQWLSRRLGQPLRVPHLGEQGFQLVGGRLLPAGTGPAGNEPGSSLARAQFMYESPSGERVTLYVSVLPQGPARPTDASTGFRFTTSGQGPLAQQSFYWIDARLGYALTAQVDRQRLTRLAEAVYQQLTPQAGVR